jgi:hypothetical protein
VKPSETNESPHDEQPDKKPQIGRREIGAFLLLLALNWTLVLLFFGASARLDSLAEALFRAESLEGPEAYAAAGLPPAAAVTPPAEPATLVAS